MWLVIAFTLALLGVSLAGLLTGIALEATRFIDAPNAKNPITEAP